MLPHLDEPTFRHQFSSIHSLVANCVAGLTNRPPIGDGRKWLPPLRIETNLGLPAGGRDRGLGAEPADNFLDIGIDPVGRRSRPGQGSLPAALSA
jgi:hypothetical protein